MQNAKITDNYKVFYRLIMKDESVEVEDINRTSLENIIRANRTLHEYGLFVQKEGDYIKYLPGSYDVNGIFYCHPVRLSNKLMLVSLKEKDFYGQSPFGISDAEKQERNNPKGIEIILRTIVNYEITAFNVCCSNSFGIFNAIRTLHYLRLYMEEGLTLDELNPNFGASNTVRLMQRYTEDCYKRIIDFVYGLKFVKWGEVFSIVGKDNRLEGGIIIVNENRNNYFAHLMNDHTDFKIVGDNKFAGKKEIEYGSIQSSKYHESEMTELDAFEYRNEIILALVKNYNPTKEILYRFYKI